MAAHAHPITEQHAEADAYYQVDLGSLGVGAYNRYLSSMHVEALMHAYKERPWAMPAIECNMREDGSLVVVNGQHRAEAGRRLGWKTMRAVVHFGWTIEEEAQTFRDSARGKKVDAISLWWAAKLAEQPDVMAIEAILARFGLHVPRRTSGASEPGAITCPDALLSVAYGTVYGGRTHRHRFKPERVEQVLHFCLKTWPEDPRRLDSRIIRILHAWFAKYGGNPAFDVREAQRKLAVYDCRDILKKTSTLVHTDSLSMVQAGVRVLTGLYDKSRRVGRLVPVESEGQGE